MPAFIDRTGQRYGRLIAISVIKSDKPNTRWLCKCDCGKECVVVGSKLASGYTKSCGCYKAELAGLQSRTHGMSKTTTFFVWSHMIRRCGDIKSPAYKNYGARGIYVCDRWKTFENFLADMGDRPPGKSIDRIDNNKGYFKENCRWATKKEQANNTRGNVFLQTPDGRRMTMAQFCEETGRNYDAVKSKRLRKGVVDGAIEVLG
jgi:hypothetical protein